MRNRRRYGLPIRVLGIGAFVLYGTVGSADWRPDDYVTMKIQIGAYTIPELDPDRLTVETKDGRVTLRGTAPSEAASRSIEDLSRRVEGVTDVTNALTIAPAPKAAASSLRSDEDIKEDLVKRLSSDAELRDSEVVVTSVQSGTVVVGGAAASLEDQLRALEITGDTAGVLVVRNEMKSPQNTVHDLDLGAGQATGADAANRRERQARDGRGVEPPPGEEAGDAPTVDKESPGAPQANPEPAGNTEPEGETTY